MVVRRKKKAGRYRGYTTHGGGHRKKRRGAGSRGGRGRAGTGKRSGHKKIGIIFPLIGKRGFSSLRQSLPANVARDTIINVGDLTPTFVQKLLAEGKAQKDKDSILIDLSALGYNKLLGTGTVTPKLKIIIERWSAQAEEKIKAAQGTVQASA